LDGNGSAIKWREGVQGLNIRGDSQGKYWGDRALTYGLQYGLDREAVQLKIRRKISLMQKYVSFDVENVIEMGCGTGLYTKEFTRLNQKLLSTDISKEMINVAKKYNPTTKFEQMDARKLPLSNGSYDLVLSTFLLQHVETNLVLPEMCRILKRGGYLGALVPNILNPLHYSRARVGLMRWILKENSQSDDFTRWQWVNLLERYGFKPICVKPIEFTSPYIPLRLMGISTKVGEMLERIPIAKEFAGTLLIVARKA